MTITPEQIKQLRDLYAKATQGTWVVGTSDKGDVDDAVFGAHYLLAEKSRYKTIREHWGAFRSLHGCAAPLYKEDAEAIAALHNSAPALLDAAERLAEVEKVLADMPRPSVRGTLVGFGRAILVWQRTLDSALHPKKGADHAE